MPSHLRFPWLLRATTLLCVGAALLGLHLTPVSDASSLQTQISGAKNAAQQLRDQIASDSSAIDNTNGGIALAQRRLDALQTTLSERVTQLRDTQNDELRSRSNLLTLENRLHRASQALSANLVAGYEGAQPDLVTVILNSHGFGQLLNQVSFLRKVGHQDASIVSVTRTARRKVAAEARRLGSLEKRDRTLAESVLQERNQEAGWEAALGRERLRELSDRAKASGNYQTVEGRISSLAHKLHVQQVKAEEAAQKAAETGNANVGGIAVDTNGYVQPPAGAPEAVRQMIAAGNAIATLPYIWGGGHASFQANGYDCSGSVSYVLAAAGLLTAPEVSGDFESYGDPGPGQWVTIYASAGHVWMTIAGWRFDTVALAEDGTRWAQGGGEFAGFVVRHPPGL